jgi:hypothetical protein
MKRESMLKKLKQRLGAGGPGLTVAVIAMVLALTGGAFAAAGKLTGPQKKEVEKIAKKFAGKNGKPGAVGPVGPAGKDGSTGANGKDGANGKNGENGKSVAVTSVPKGAPCKEGGVTVEVEGSGVKKPVCNGEEGKEGEKGEEGSPWTAGGTLPPGSTETGAWAFTATSADSNGIRVPISFPIPIVPRLKEAAVHYEGETEFGTFCPEGSLGAPTAAPGNLCVYTNQVDEPPVKGTTLIGIFPPSDPEGASLGKKGTNSSGAILTFASPVGNASGAGTFAITAPLP